TTAEERRRSRVELWHRQGTFGQALLYPQFDGRDMTVWATTAEARTLLHRDRETFLTNCVKVDGIDVDAVRAFVEDGPEVLLYPHTPGAGPAPDAPPIENGIGFRIRIPYLKPELIDLRLNGHLLNESATDGYQAFLGNGYTQVQVNVPPDKAREMGLYIITCAYAPDVQRSFGWSPPAEVMDRLKAKSE
ncbi:MAG: hypothetical protein GY851_29210, partial [bacterium]|nr:hypothetical protein [bacterium]